MAFLPAKASHPILPLEGVKGKPLVAAVSLCLLTGCAGFYDEIFLNRDGSGTYVLTVIVKDREKKEDLGTLQLRTREQALKIAQAAGFTDLAIQVSRDGDLLIFMARAHFPSLSVFANASLSVSSGSTPWSFIVPREIRFEGGRFTARVLRGSAPAKGAPIRSSFKGHEARFTVYLPGRVVESNGAVLENSASWAWSLDQLCDLPIEMQAVAHREIPWLPLALGAALLAGLVVLVVSLFRKRSPPPRAACG